MTQDEIIEMATQAGMDYLKYISPESFKKVTVFAKLVAERERERIIAKNAPVIKQINEHIKELQDAVKAEREACAKLFEQGDEMGEWYSYEVAKAIRARGQA